MNGFMTIGIGIKSYSLNHMMRKTNQINRGKIYEPKTITTNAKNVVYEAYDNPNSAKHGYVNKY